MICLFFMSLVDAECTKDEKYSAACCALLGIPLLFKESALLGHSTEPQPGVYIKFTSPDDRFLDCTLFCIFVDGQQIVEAGDLVKGLAGYLACYYVFNISYPKELEMTITFLERTILKTIKVLKYLSKKVKQVKKSPV